MDLKIVAGLIAAFLPFVAYAPYLRGTWTGKIKPHPFSWIIWGSCSAIVIILLWNTGGGWAILRQFSLIALCLIVAILAFARKGSFAIKLAWSDWACLALAAIALTFYVFAKNPLVAMSLIIFAETLALIPTITKVRRAPFSENQSMWWIQSTVGALALIALAEYNATTLTGGVGGLLINVTGLTFIVLGQYRAQRKRAVVVEVENE